jgi:HPt (histidine-containing phosphotransfer) domain-containing protein
LKDKASERVHTAAHSLKGMLSFIEISQGVDLARQLEFMGRDNALDQASPVLADLVEINDRVLASIASIRESCKPVERNADGR